MKEKTPFLITIDTEGDNLWAAPRQITTKNSAFLPRFQKLCETFGFKPVYLTNYEMACDVSFVEMAKFWQDTGRAEIGLHLHAWNSPPIEPLTKDDFAFQPYLIEYPEKVIESKVGYLTDLLESRFQKKMVSHRAGRWAMDARYFRILAKMGYEVDCSVTPHVSWKKNYGDPEGSGGSDYTKFPERPYRTAEGIWEIPMTIGWKSRGPLVRGLSRAPKLGGLFKRAFPEEIWLRPNGVNVARMMRLSKEMAEKNGYLEFMLHSSELMPGGSPYFRTQRSVERLYDHLNALFEFLSPWTVGVTLQELVRSRLNA